MENRERALAYVRAHRNRFVAELKGFVRFPSVSAQPERAGAMRECARWLARHMRSIGLHRVTLAPTAGQPIVYGEWRQAAGAPTVLIYGHYDVQPAEPLDAWRTPPFEPVVRGENLFGRGASDDKGQLFAHLKALEAWLRTTGELPLNVVCLFEGEEEIGGSSLPAFLSRNGDALRADVAVLSDTPILAPNRPAIAYAMRGSLSLELEVKAGAHDLHSGNFGGAVPNALQILCAMIARLHDAQGRVVIPGFYERVRNLSMAERDYLARNGPSDAALLRDAGSLFVWGEPEFSLYERLAIRPALSINGIVGGYGGTGPKAVIPARAMAKFNFRLVPDQNPSEIEQLFRRYVARITPPGTRVSVRVHYSAQPVLMDREHPAMRAAADACRRGFGVAPAFIRIGGTVPAVALFRDLLGIPSVPMGFALPDDRMHGPNEKFHLPTFFRGIETILHFLGEIATRLPVARPLSRPSEQAGQRRLQTG